MADTDELLLQIRTLITENWKIEDDQRMGEVRALFVQARLDHARDCGVVHFNKKMAVDFAGEFDRILSEARAFESADLLRDQVTILLFTLPASDEVGQVHNQSVGKSSQKHTGKTLPYHLN